MFANFLKKTSAAFSGWVDSSAYRKQRRNEYHIDWVRILPFIGMHLAVFAVLWVGFSWVALWTAVFLYGVRIFAIGAFYHRYFSHRTFKTSRPAQFVFALLGAMAVQRGPLWWASHHRYHHAVTDTPDDPHSMKQHGFWWSHMGWFLSDKHFFADEQRVRDWRKFPELVFLDRFDMLIPLALMLVMFLFGELLAVWAPGLGTDGWQMMIWGFFVSTVAVFHVTVSINSITHYFGKRRFSTRDESRNSWWLALLTFGEGWHNNHHHYPASTRQGFYWWEFDLTYYLLKLLSFTGLVWDLKPVPSQVLAEGRG